MARQVRCFKLGLKPRQKLRQPDNIPRSHKQCHRQQNNFKAYVLIFPCLHLC